MPSQQTPITAYVPAELADRLKQAATTERLSISQYLRRILERQFKLQATEMPRRGRPPKQIEQPQEKSA